MACSPPPRNTRAGWETFVNAPPRQRPDLLSAAQIRKLPEQARAEYEERRSVWHANIGPLRTPQMRAVHEGGPLGNVTQNVSYTITVTA